MQVTRGVGTHSYAAPEQLASKDSDSLFQSDVYSLGIVLLELLCPFRTDMERHKTIKNLREHHALPPDIKEKWPCLVRQNLSHYCLLKSLLKLFP